ncbi:MAG: hypothetical protein KTR31_05215 [Myxococcales bacterium]|nr:hypothetical protein [Myxococcales bacterium]
MVTAALHALARAEPELARQFEAGWNTTAAAWSARQWTPPDDPGFEPAFRAALVGELTPRLGAGTDAWVAQVEAGGAVLTPHHVCPTPGPTFGAIDRVASLGHDGPVLVLAWSGVPMSNTASSGALCFAQAELDHLLQAGPELKRQRQAAKDRARDGVVAEKRLTLLPSGLRDALVYQCPAPQRLHDVFAAATDELRAVMPSPEEHERYPAWCLRAAEAVQRRVLQRDDLFYVDLNAVARRYLLTVLEQPDHPVTRLLTMSPDTLPDLEGMSWFYARKPGKREKVRTLYGCPDELQEGLASGEVCPGLVVVFGALRCLSRIRLLGGFRQVLYLEDIARAWTAAGLAAQGAGVPGRLMTGRLTADGRPVYPLDVALGLVDRAVLPGPDTPMSTLWEPMLARVEARASR